VQCTRCKYWVHCGCENLQFGRVPPAFVCQRCGGKEFPLPPLVLPDSTRFPDKVCASFSQKSEIVQTVPDGPFRHALAEAFDQGEVSIQKMIGSLFRTFVQLFFDRQHDFWRCFVDAIAALFEVEKQTVLALIDGYATGFLYSTAKPVEQRELSAFAMSESITQFIESATAPRMEKKPSDVPLTVGSDGFVHTAVPLDDGQFICDLPGFLMHCDEMDAAGGIPLSCFALTDTDCVVDLEGSTFQFAHAFARSFHFNTFVRVYRVVEETRVGLFATRLHGPLSEEKGKRGTAIPADGVLLLPFDGEVPYPVPKLDWKERKAKVRAPASAARVREVRSAGQQKKKPKPIECPVTLSLLSAFCEDIVPPMPFVLLTENDLQERIKRENPARARTKVHRT
jgi:hypothetical protein